MKNPQKTRIIYNEGYDPNRKGVTHVAIQALENPPYVWCTYSVRSEKDLPSLPSDLPILHIDSARALFKFEKRTFNQEIREKEAQLAQKVQ